MPLSAVAFSGVSIPQEIKDVWFGVEVSTINYHLKEIYNSGELAEEATIRKIRIVQQEGKRNVERELDFYFASEMF